MAESLSTTGEVILAYHKQLKEGGVSEALLHELVAIAARGVANKA